MTSSLGLRLTGAVLAAVSLAAPTLVSASAAEQGGAPPARPPIVASGDTCDALDGAHCLLPFPNDHFTVSDGSTDTGLRLDLDLAGMPRNAAQKPIDPTELNRNDGFSPGSVMMTYVAGLDLDRTWAGIGVGSDHPANGNDHITDLGREFAADSPIVLLNAATGERAGFWSELDTHPQTQDPRRLLLLRPSTNLEEGANYIVAMRNLKDANGAVIPAGPTFAAYRDQLVPPLVDQRAGAMNKMFATLAEAGIGRDDLYLAWDFTVASERNLTERVLHMRDETFADLGDTDLADRVISGASPEFTIDSMEITDGRRRIRGTVTVPNYLDALVESPAAPDQIPEIGGESQYVPGSKLLFDPFTGLPMQNPAQPTLDVPFVCQLPRHVTSADPADPYLYGHGLLGGTGEATGSSAQDLQDRGFAMCATHWLGMSSKDLANVAAILADPSLFVSLADRAQQGFLNWMVLGRAVMHPEGFSAEAEFHDAGGALLDTSGRLSYDGNSQGGIMGPALMALSPDIERGVFGVPGINYSTLLQRSVDWEDLYAIPYYANFPDMVDRQLGFSLFQTLWDRAEGNGYAHHTTSDPLPNTPTHQALIHPAFSDHQVTNIAAEVMARTFGAELKWPSLDAGRHWSADGGAQDFTLTTFVPGGPAPYGLVDSDADGNVQTKGSYLVYWDSIDRGLSTPPNGNLPAAAGSDPHSDPRKDERSNDQKAHFLRTGELLNPCLDFTLDGPIPGACRVTDASKETAAPGDPIVHPQPR